MPHADGYALIREVRGRSDPALARVPALALTGYGSVMDRRQILDGGFRLPR